MNDLGEPAQNAGHRGGVACQTSAGASDLRAPACSSEFESLKWGRITKQNEPPIEVSAYSSTFSLTLPHDLLDRSHLK